MKQHSIQSEMIKNELIDRVKEKDAYDIYCCLKQHSDRLHELVSEFRPNLKNSLIQEGLAKLA